MTTESDIVLRFTEWRCEKVFAQFFREFVFPLYQNEPAGLAVSQETVIVTHGVVTLDHEMRKTVASWQAWRKIRFYRPLCWRDLHEIHTRRCEDVFQTPSSTIAGIHR